MSDSSSRTDELCVNAIRFMSVDAIERAQSGHPGMPLGAAPMAYVLFDRILRFNPGNPDWPDRDRFVLSAGHGSSLLYSLLHLFGYDLSLDEVKNFRQWGSQTPGHPEYGCAPGVETTTGPLGQGFATAVGMAIAERFLANHFNREGFTIVDHRTYVLAGDGDLMEGVAAEATSLAGHLKLGRLIVLHDDNLISLEGSTELAFTENVEQHFEACGWQVLRVPDTNDLDTVEAAIRAAQSDQVRPSLIMIRSHIGYGSPKQDSHLAHSEALGPEALRSTKEKLGWPVDPPFLVPEEAATHFRRATDRGGALEREWQELFKAYRAAHPQPAAEFERALSGQLPDGWDADFPSFAAGEDELATRDAAGQVANALAARHPTFMGGAADVGPSTRTYLFNCGDFGLDGAGGRNIRFGVREHAMGAIVNGMALHGGLLPWGATFLVFADYLRGALRLAAMMQARAVFLFTHDSISQGEDGPTHQPVEQLTGLRTIPGLTVLRPADANETVAAWRVAATRAGPVALVLTKWGVPVLDAASHPIAEGVPRGAYVLAEGQGGKPDIVVVATGSEVHLALDARAALEARGVRARVVSMPSWELFDEQPAEYRASVLPADLPKLAVEAAHPMGWRAYVGDGGDVIGLARFGASAPGPVVCEKLGFSVENVVQRALRLVEA